MNNPFEFIGSNFERLLRWVYPGALFIVLLYATHPEFLQGEEGLYSKIGIWGLVTGGLVIGAVIYLFQSYVVGSVITVTFILLKWDVRQGIQRPLAEWETKEEEKPRYCLRYWLCLFDRMARAARERYSGNLHEKVGNYLDYA